MPMPMPTLMSPRRTILRELSRQNGEATNVYTRPASIAGFAEKPARFQAAVNELLQERLINGTKDEEGRLAIAINAQRLKDVRRELRAWWQRPATWVVAVLALGIGLAVGAFL
jgi:hypothetical protein